MKIVKLGAVVVTGAFLIGFSNAPVLASSLATQAFLRNAEPNIDFLDRSSRFALTNSKSAHLRDFARSEAREQTMAANAIDDWIEANKAPLVASTVAEPAVETGRSVAVDGQAPQGAEPAADLRLTLGQEDLDRLEGLTDAEFDSLYKEKQLDALSQVETDYKDYLAKGDDPALLAIAKSELPKVQKRLALLRKI